MNDTHLSDRIPEVARGDREWTASEAAHLERCPACDREWRLIGAAVTSQRADAPINLERIVAGVVAATIEPVAATIPIPTDRRHWLRYSLAGLAAAATLVMVLRLTIEPAGQAAPDGQAMAIGILPELDQLTPAELNGVLAEYSENGASGRPLGEIPRLGELTDGELNELLSEVGG